MPELPEVQTVVTTLAPRVAGKRIERIPHVRRDMITPDGFDLAGAVRGRTIESVTRRGKRIVFLLDDGNRFFIHLGMTGRLMVESRDTDQALHTHLIFDIGDGRQLRFRDPRRFGEIRWLGQDNGDAKMGPEPLDMRASQLADCLTRTTRAVKNALMDQSVVAGLGNIYVDESLHAAGIHPLARADRLKPQQIAKLTQSIKRVLRKAIRHRGSTLRDYVDAEGGKGAFQLLHNVYNRKGEPCRTCKSPIVRIVLGGRSTCFCPRCQSRSTRPQATSSKPRKQRRTHQDRQG
jgi:formamidopyrimidine-DNA glycosylase